MHAVRVALIWVLGFASLAKAQTNFSIQDIQANPDSSVTIAWPTVPQTTYHVMFADSLDDAWQDFSDGRLTAGSNVWSLCYTDTNSLAVTQRFYKVRITRLPVIMTLVLDRSGSMDPARGPPPSGDGTGSGGGAYLPAAVTAFINNFDETRDKAAMVSFATIQLNVFYDGGTPPQPTQPFKSAVSAAVNTLVWNGATFSQGGLANALVLENNASIAAGQSAVKVVVFFTDGFANVIQDTFDCPPSTTMNYGGMNPVFCPDPIHFFDSITGALLCTPATDGGVPPCCPGATNGFVSVATGFMEPFTCANVNAEARFRAMQVAGQMRNAGITVYSVGVGTGIDLTFLQQVANDSSAPGYMPTPYDGEAVIANDPSQLSAVFQSIASRILYQ